MNLIKRLIASEPVLLWSALVGALLQAAIAWWHPAPDIETGVRAVALAITGLIARQQVSPN